MTKTEMTEKLLGYILPREIYRYFDIVKVQEIDKDIHLYLEEKPEKPEEYSGDKLLSKGFHEEIEIKDFSIRSRGVLLHVRRRRWKNESTCKVVSRDWESVAKGTHYTQEFAFFLKEIVRQLSNRKSIP